MTSPSPFAACKRDGWMARMAVLDCDVHQGNGPRPSWQPTPPSSPAPSMGEQLPAAQGARSLDVDLPDGSGDAEYLVALEKALARILAEFRPGLLFYQAGVDPLTGDRFGRLALTREGLRRRDRLVLEACRDAHIPVAVTLGGDTISTSTRPWTPTATPSG